MLKEELLNRYGPTMTISDLAEVFRITKGAIYNKLSKKKFEIDVFKLGGALYADTLEVASYIESAKLMKR
jgi:AcrR family transcriptional regulator